MSYGSAAMMSTLDDDARDDLLSFIEERRVILIVGCELLLVTTDQDPRLLLDWVAEKLAGPLNVEIAELPQPYTLNDVVCWFLEARGGREGAYVRMRSIIKQANFEPPCALRRLAAITDVDLFVSTTFEPLLEQAIKLERFSGAASTDVLSYAPNRVTDLPSEREHLQRAVVYHLFGKISAAPTYVISDEDLLEYICASQSEHVAPDKLFHELEHGAKWLPGEFAAYAQAFAEDHGHGALLHEAAAKFDTVPPSIRPLQDVRQLRAAARGAD